MKVLCEFLTGLVLILSVGISAHYANLEASYSNDLNHKITSSVAADFNPIGLELPGDVNVPVALSSEYCMNIYTLQYTEILTIGGIRTLKCSGVNVWQLVEYFRFHDFRQLQQEFVKNMRQCFSKNYAVATECYVNLLSRIFDQISGTTSTLHNYKLCIKEQLISMAMKLNKVTKEEAECLAKVANGANDYS